jgi:hypothetical protein
MSFSLFDLRIFSVSQDFSTKPVKNVQIVTKVHPLIISAEDFPRLNPEKEHHVSVIQGKCFDLPSKIIVPAGKSLSCLYRVPDLKKITTNSNQKTKITFNTHPFLGERFMIVSGVVPPEKKKPKIRDENKPVEKNVSNLQKRELFYLFE